MKRLIDEVPGLEVAAEASDGIALINLRDTLAPEMVILDISMPGMGGIGVTREIRRHHPQVKVLILTLHKNTEYLYTAIATGAHGYLLKEDSDIDLFEAIRTIRAGKNHITGKLTGDMASDISKIVKDKGQLPRKPLTSRERQVLKLIAEGKLNREIAAMLDISVRTVENHRAKVMKKLNSSKTDDLVKYALQQGMADLTL